MSEGRHIPMDDAVRQAVWEMDRDHFIHPYADLTTFAESGSQIIADGSGPYVTDAGGRRYLDAIAGLWCVNIGHGRGEMADAIAAQVRSLQYYNPFGATTNVPAARLAARLAALAPGDLDHVFFTTGGSTATDMAVQLVHHYANRTGRPLKKRILSRRGAYHGATYLAATLTGIEATGVGFDAIGGFVEHVGEANMYRRPEGMDEDGYCDHLVREIEARILALGPETIGAFIAEPVMGAGGVLVAPRGYHRRVHDVCRAHDILYIADEVVTGFGRLGHMFASEALFGMCPDVLCVAKGITSGYVPLGATILSRRIYDVLKVPGESRMLPRGYTYSGHAVACAAALTNIDIIEREDICAHVLETAPYLQEQARRLLASPLVGDVRGCGFMLGVELVADKARKTSFPTELAVAQRVYENCLRHGVIVRPVGNVVVVSPPLILDRSECAVIVDALEASLAELAADETLRA
ncbi:MAG: aminotransferase [Sphingomonas sp.]